MNSQSPRTTAADPHGQSTAVKFFTPGVWVLILIALAGIAIWAARFVFGLGAVTNLDDQYPWGIWIGIDVATGVALAAGGFTSAFVAHIMHNGKYHTLVRPALLTAMLGYTFVAIGVFTDLGRYYSIWHVMLPENWQGNSALLEVGLCVMLYLTVLYIEFLPIVCDRFIGRVNLPGLFSGLNNFLDKTLRLLDRALNKVIWVFIIMGVVLSCAHQSSLGTLMAIAPTKLHPLWHTSILPLHFLLSAFAVGIAMVVFESLLASRSLRLPYEMNILKTYSRLIPVLLIIYLAAKVIDLINRGAHVYLLESSLESTMWLIEIGAGVVLPILIIFSSRLRQRVGWLFTAAALVVGGVALNRVDVFIIGYHPPYAESVYVPALGEIAVTAGFISLLILFYRFFVFNFPVIEHFRRGNSHA
jgi:Ni/Fe-hydrogenase subunit HybB-like protein